MSLPVEGGRMKLILVVAAALNLLSAAAIWIVARKWGVHIYGKGFRDGEFQGYRKGHDAGREIGENWWIQMEQEVKAERQKIWKEEE